jgi:hypothetical protein
MPQARRIYARAAIGVIGFRLESTCSVGTGATLAPARAGSPLPLATLGDYSGGAVICHEMLKHFINQVGVRSTLWAHDLH